MAANHIVEQGEYLIKIARDYGFDDYRPIWDHPRNAELKAKRLSPNALYPGDILFIPDQEASDTGYASGKRWVIQLKPKAEVLRLLLKNIDDEPLAYTPCTLNIGEKVYAHITNSEGMVAEMIPKGADRGTLSVQGMDVTLQIGDLDPIESAVGQVLRLANLGYYLGRPDEPDENLLKSAVEEFQCDHGIPVTGECDAQTRDALKNAHGS
jgi:hypothetical protein